MTGRELDLYDGVARGSPAPTAGGAAMPTSPTGTPAPDDWLALVWQRFPAVVRERYQPRAAIGEGGMGVILEAFDRVLDRVVAIKGVRDPHGLPPEERARRLREAQLAARLAHPGILPVHDVWQDADGNPWCSMLRVPAAPGDAGGNAPTLESRLAELAGVPLERRPLVELLGIFAQIGRAIAFAHAHGVVHRDIKPANVLLGPSREALVADWGVAVELARPGELTVAGTPGYAAPEQVGLDGPVSVDARSDVYSLGVLLAELLGAPPRRAPAAPLALPARTPRELAAIVAKATARAPAERFPDVASLVSAVEAHQSGGLVEGLRYGPGERLAKWIQRRPGQAVALAGALVLALVVVRENERLRAEREKTEQQIALMHAAAAGADLADRRRDEARARAALSFEAGRRGGADWRLPQGPVWRAFASQWTASPLRWACRVPAVPTSVRFTTGSTSLVVTTTGPVAYTIPLPDSKRHVTRAWPGGDATAFSPVWQMTLDPSARWLTRVTSARTLHLSEVATGRDVASIEAPRLQEIWAFSPRGDRLALLDSVGPDAGGPGRGQRSRVRVVSVPGGRQIASFDPGFPRVWALAFAPGGDHLVLGDVGGGIAMLDAGGSVLWRQTGPGSPLAIEFDPQGGWLLLAGAYDRVMRRDARTGAVLTSYGSGLKNTLSLAISPGGRRFATGGQDGILRLWDVESGRQLAALGGHDEWIWNIGWSPDGRTLATAAGDGTVRMWDVDEALRPEAPGGEMRVRALAFTPGGDGLAVGRRDGEVEWREPGGRLRGAARVPGAVAALAFDAEGRLTSIHAVPGTTSVMAASTATRAGGPFVEVLRFDAARATVAGRVIAAVTHDGRVTVHRLDGGKSWDVPRAPGALSGFALSRDGAQLALGSKTGDVRVIDLATTRERALPRAPWCVMGLGFSPDGRTLVAGGERSLAEGGVTVYDLGRDALVTTVQHHYSPVFQAVVSDAARHVVTSAQDGLRVLRDGVRVLELDVGSEHAGALALSADGRALAWSSGALVDVWDLTAVDDVPARVREIQAQSFFEYDPASARLSVLPIEAAPPAR